MKPDATLFISIASYRDAELYPTLRNLIDEADAPARLHIAVCWQDDGDIKPFLDVGLSLISDQAGDTYHHYQFQYRQAQIDVIALHYFASQGACWARHQAEKWYQQERYFLQVDSHCRFIPRWDHEMIAILESLREQSPHPVLSTYPPGYTPGGDEDRKNFVSRLVFNAFTPQGIVGLTSTPFCAAAPQRSGYLAAGFVFADGHFVTTVPNDPHIFFMGEEIAMAARAWTHGYDIWSPDRVLLWHFYGRAAHPKIWGDHSNDAKKSGDINQVWWERDNVSKARVLSVLNASTTPCDLGIWGIGQKRTLTEFQYRIGVDFREQRVHPAAIGVEKIGWFESLPLHHQQWRQMLQYINEKKLLLKRTEADFTRTDTVWWHVGVYSAQNKPLMVKNYSPEAISHQLKQIDVQNVELKIHFTAANCVPAHSVRICPYIAESGWGELLEKAW